MTGGQTHDGPLDPGKISRQLAAEGVKPIIVVTDEPEKYPDDYPWAEGVTVRHRAELMDVQRELREMPGVSAMIYDQTCASEKRRRRKKGTFPDPAKRAVINEAVCEGCGDCSKQSNCLSVEPLETELGRKRQINQSSCNKDFSCVSGFCPSFVTVEGGGLKKPKKATTTEAKPPALPMPVIPSTATPYGILVTGIGGTGVVTVGQILAVSAHIEGKGALVLDMSGLAQKGGPVMSHVRLADRQSDLHSTRVGTGNADLVIGCDQIVTASRDALSRMGEGRTRAFVNGSGATTAAFIKNPDWQFPAEGSRGAILQACGADNVDFIDAGQIATTLMGDAIATNMFMLGYAFQKGQVPLREASIMKAIELNGVSVAFNKAAFEWGRTAAHDLASVVKLTTPATVVEFKRAPKLADLVERRVELLTAYQNAAYAESYREFVAKVRAAEEKIGKGTRLSEAVARYLHKLMAYKDEYEVARLHSDPAFMKKIDAMFEGDVKVKFHLAPPLFAKKDKDGHLVKQEFGPWMMKAFGVLAKFKGLRGTALDPFGHTEERRIERALIQDYRRTIEALLPKLDSAKPGAGGGDRQRAGRHPRLRPRQGTPPGRRQAPRSGTAGRLQRQRRGLARSLIRRPGSAAGLACRRRCRFFPTVANLTCVHVYNRPHDLANRFPGCLHSHRHLVVVRLWRRWRRRRKRKSDRIGAGSAGPDPGRFRRLPEPVRQAAQRRRCERTGLPGPPGHAARRAEIPARLGRPQLPLVRRDPVDRAHGRLQRCAGLLRRTEDTGANRFGQGQGRLPLHLHHRRVECAVQRRPGSRLRPDLVAQCGDPAAHLAGDHRRTGFAGRQGRRPARRHAGCRRRRRLRQHQQRGRRGHHQCRPVPESGRRIAPPAAAPRRRQLRRRPGRGRGRERLGEERQGDRHATGKVGYLTFDDFNAVAEKQLIDAFTMFRSQGASDLVIDMRYNGGGLLYIASELAYMVAGPATAGQTFERLQYNDKTAPGAPIPFLDSAYGFPAPVPARAGQALPWLGLKRVTVLTTAGTCSASEAVINGLRGVDVQVDIIGAQTCGKPYGFTPVDNCGTTYFSIEFQGVNAKGFGDFADGFAPTCMVPDDLSRAQGDPAEGLLAAALAYRSAGTARSSRLNRASVVQMELVRPEAKEIAVLPPQIAEP
jgi:Pyruvate/2-oxoacid:ferredoxin oxidoreductase gamma subunit